MTGLVPLFPGVPGGPELMIILLIVVLLFGANKVPQLARASGQAMGEFRRGRDDIEREIREGETRSSTAEPAETADETA
ncbi:MAG: twin-arginine translocase TatA/TatE family subunit [Haloferacaceae archaeon]